MQRADWLWNIEQSSFGNGFVGSPLNFSAWSGICVSDSHPATHSVHFSKCHQRTVHPKQPLMRNSFTFLVTDVFWLESADKGNARRSPTSWLAFWYERQYWVKFVFALYHAPGYCWAWVLVLLTIRKIFRHHLNQPSDIRYDSCRFVLSVCHCSCMRTDKRRGMQKESNGDFRGCTNSTSGWTTRVKVALLGTSGLWLIWGWRISLIRWTSF